MTIDHSNEVTGVLEHLKQICDAATPGKWDERIHTHHVADQVPRFWAAGPVHEDPFHMDEAKGAAEADAAFIATFNPATVRLLLAVVVAVNDFDECCDKYEDTPSVTRQWMDVRTALAALREGMK